MLARTSLQLNPKPCRSRSLFCGWRLKLSISPLPPAFFSFFFFLLLSFSRLATETNNIRYTFYDSDTPAKDAAMSRPTTTDDLVKRLQDTVISQKERVVLQALATEMVKVFSEKKNPHLGHEAAALALVATPESYKELLWAFDNAIAKGTADDNVLHPHLCKGFVHVLRCSIPREAAGHTSTKIDMGLGTALSSLKKRLESAVAQGDPNAEYRLVLTLGSVLHAMYDVQMAGIDRETLQKPLLDMLDTLSKDKEIRLAQAAAYAREALRCIPDSDGPYKILLRNLVNVVGAASKIAGAVATMDASKLFDGAVALADVPDLASAMVDVVEAISVAMSNLDAVKETVGKQRKRKIWYVALRYSDMLIQNRAFASLEFFLDNVPCRHDIDFLCGISAQLEQVWVQAAAAATHTGTNTDTDDDGAQALAMRARVQDVLASLPEPKSRSDTLHGVLGGHSDNSKRLAAWKDAVAGTMRGETPQPDKDQKNKDYKHSLGCYTVTFESLPTDLLSKAWLRCTRAQLFYADASLLKYYLASDEHLLQIQRLSRARLTMENCYINLNIIKASETSNETVPLRSLFDPRTCNDGAMRVPRRILICGAAGVGKTTLSKKIVYELTRSPVSPEFQSWTAAYDRVIWLPLRNLKRHNPGTNYRLMDLFRAEYMSKLPDEEVLARVLHDHCLASSSNHRKSSRTLFLLDGLDEMSEQLDSDHQAAKFLTHLLDQPDVIITSRPGARIPDALQPLDCELETTGFNDDQVRQYVRYSLPDRRRAEDLLWFLHRRRFLSSLVTIPVQLDALCYIWQDNNPDDDNHATKAAQSIETLTAVYRAIEDKLWRKDIPRLEKGDVRGRPITEAKVRARRTREKIRELVRVEASFLQFLAFSGLVSETVYFDERYCDDVQQHMDAPHLHLAGSVDDVLPHVSFLRTLEASTTPTAPDPMAAKDLHRTYHFIHLTYQEYFAAQYFVGRWTAGKELAFFSSKDSQSHVIGTDRFIADHKYDARYSVFWRFVAGLLHNGTDAPDTACLGRFFDALESEPRDIVGREHQKLVVQCLVEADPAQDMALFDAHRSLLKEWVVYELDRWKTLRLLTLFSFPERISGPIVLDETGTVVLSKTTTLELVQDNFLRHVPPDLCITDASGRMPLATCKVLRKLPFLPHNVLQAITERFQLSPIDRSHHSLEVLGQHLGNALPYLLDCLGHTTGFVRANAATAFAEIARSEVALSPEAVAALVLCVNDVFESASFNAMVALCNVQPFPREAIGVICAQLRHEKDSVRKAAAEAVKQARTLPVEVFSEITERLLDPAQCVRLAAIKVFQPRQRPLPDSILDRLAQFLGSSSEVKRAAAINALRTISAGASQKAHESRMPKVEDSCTSHPVFDRLIALLHHGPSSQIRAIAALAFRTTAGPLPAHIYKQLAVGLADPHSEVRGCTAVALSYHMTPLVLDMDEILLGILSHAENFDDVVKQYVFDVFPKDLPLSPTTMHILAQKLCDSTTSPFIRTWLLKVFQLQAGRLSESTVQTLATLQEIQTEAMFRQMGGELYCRFVYFTTTQQIASVLGACQSLPEGVQSNLLKRLSSSQSGDDIAQRSLSSITALSHRYSVSQPVLAGILSCLTSSAALTRSRAEETLYRKSTLPLNILQPLLQYTVRVNDAPTDSALSRHIFRHMVDRPDAELASLLQPDKGNARFVFECCLSMARYEPVLCYSDGETHYAFVVGGKKRRVRKTYFSVNPEDILRELGVPAGLPRVWEDRIAEESVQGGKGEDGEKGDDGKYRSGHIFVIFAVLFVWASFYVSFV